MASAWPPAVEHRERRLASASLASWCIHHHLRLFAAREHSVRVTPQIFVLILIIEISSKSIFEIGDLLKPSQNKKGQKIIQLHRFLNTFSQLLAVKSIQKTVQLENLLALLILTWL
jgi:hypothetical protein